MDDKIHDEYERTFARLLSALVPVPGCDDRYVIYSEREKFAIVVSLNPKKPDGAYTAVKVRAEGFKTYPSWKIPGVVTTALRSYLYKFIADIRGIVNTL